jgi:hypothetical protein
VAFKRFSVKKLMFAQLCAATLELVCDFPAISARKFTSVQGPFPNATQYRNAGTAWLFAQDAIANLALVDT